MTVNVYSASKVQIIVIDARGRSSIPAAIVPAQPSWTITSRTSRKVKISSNPLLVRNSQSTNVRINSRVRSIRCNV